MKRPSLISYSDRPLSRGIPTPSSIGGSQAPLPEMPALDFSKPSNSQYVGQVI